VGEHDAPPGGLAEAQARLYEALVLSVERGEVEAAAAAMIALVRP